MSKGETMNNQQLQIFGNSLQRYKKTFFGLGAGFCYLLAGQPLTAVAAPKDNQEPTKRRQNIGRLIKELNAKCENKSLLDKLKNQPAKENLLGPVGEPIIMVGTDGCPGTTIPAGTSFTDTGTTIGANNTVNNVQTGCSNYTTTAGPDVIYRFTLPALASRIATCSITVTPTGATGYDTSIYILSNSGTGCPAGPNAAVTNCLNGADAGSFNVAETITDAEIDAMPAGTYYLFVDSFYSVGSTGQPNRHNGPYSLNFVCTTVATPTAASISVSGKVISPNGTGLSRVSVSATDSTGETRYATTNSFGYYKFEGLRAGELYIFEASSKKYQFSNPTQVVSVNDNIADLNFSGIE